MQGDDTFIKGFWVIKIAFSLNLFPSNHSGLYIITEAPMGVKGIVIAALFFNESGYVTLNVWRSYLDARVSIFSLTLNVVAYIIYSVHTHMSSVLTHVHMVYTHTRPHLLSCYSCRYKLMKTMCSSLRPALSSPAISTLGIPYLT